MTWGTHFNTPGKPLAMCPLKAADERHESYMQRASKALLSAIRTGKGEDEFPWNMTAGNFPNNGILAGIVDRRVAIIRERDEKAETLRVYREPCPRCGVRADLHAEHGCSREVRL